MIPWMLEENCRRNLIKLSWHPRYFVMWPWFIFSASCMSSFFWYSAPFMMWPWWMFSTSSLLILHHSSSYFSTRHLYYSIFAARIRHWPPHPPHLLCQLPGLSNIRLYPWSPLSIYQLWSSWTVENMEHLPCPSLTDLVIHCSKGYLETEWSELEVTCKNIISSPSFYRRCP